ncbi:hypothetical protein BG011_001200 [Mortierella polycephala]|uniref:Uncharacterized protein n=1 Tax=Mortierella polycephala TaxID=41804 RepID=A0A9P6QI71_9FUNG|nr:hypothetical protein BG011_001200 [Mortierella polycephala]
MDIDDFEDEMILDEEDLITPSLTGEELMEEGARFAGGRTPNVRVVDKNFFNEHSATVLNMACYFTTNKNTIQEIVSAKVIRVCQEGLVIEGRTDRGDCFDVSVAFPNPIHSLIAVKDTFMHLGKIAETGTPRSKRPHRRQIPGQPPGLGVYWPNWNPFLIALAAGVISFFYIYFFPDTRIPPFRWTKSIVGMDKIRFCVHFAIGLHSFQTITALYLMKRVAKCEFTLKQTLIWSGCVQLFGIGSMLKLLPIVYYSKFVNDGYENGQTVLEHNDHGEQGHEREALLRYAVV